MFLQLSGQKFINTDHVAAVEFGPFDGSKQQTDRSDNQTDFFGLTGPLAYNTAYVYFHKERQAVTQSDGRGSKFLYTLLFDDDARILATYFDQHRER